MSTQYQKQKIWHTYTGERMILPKNGQDLASIYPEIAEEWDFELNDLGPDCYFPRSNKTVNWICKLGHRWPAKINNRTTRGTQCPCCSGSIPIRGVNDLETLFPHLAQEWDYTKNDRPPSDFLPKSNVRVNWICKNGHRWDSKIYHRAEGRRCPSCAGLRPIIGENDLETMYPAIAKEWHPTKNGNNRPSEYTTHSHHEAIWLCPEGHEYPSPIYRRVRGCGCSVCDGKRIIPGINDLATRAPKIAEEWHSTKNKNLSPQMIPLHYNKRVWWYCNICGHEWRTSPNNRINNNTGCPACSHCVVVSDVNSLDAVNPELAEQWDAEQNSPLTPKDVAAYDNRDYFWLCEHGHSWQASPANRNKGTKCPYCAGKKPIVGINDLKSVLPQIALEWHPTKNGDALPEHYLPNSHFEAWWQCSNGHEWQKAIYERAYGNTCPVCGKRKTPIRRHI